MQTLKQPIELTFVEPKTAPKGLADTLKLLKDIESHISKLSAGPSISPKFNQSVEEINKAFLKRKEGMRPYEFGSLAKSLGLDDKEINQVKSQLQKLDKVTRSGVGMTGKNMTFSDLGGAAKAFRLAMDRSIADTEKNFSRLFSGGAGGGSAKAGGIKVEGKIDVLIPAAQFQASVIGVIPINIPASQFTAGGGRDPATGQFLPGGGGGAGGGDAAKKEKKKAELQGVPKGVPKTVPDEIARTVTQTTKGATEAITTLLNGGKTLTKTFDDVGEQIKVVTKDPKLRNIGKSLRENLTVLSNQAQADFLNKKTGDKANDLMLLSRVKTTLADNILKSFNDQKENLPAPARESLQKIYTAQANKINGQAREAERLSGLSAAQINAQKEKEAKAQREQQQRESKRQADDAARQKKKADADAARDYKDRMAQAGPQADAKVHAAKRESIGKSRYEAAQKLAQAHEERAKIYEQLANEQAFSHTKRAGYARQAESSRAASAKFAAVPPPGSAPGLTERLGLNARLSAVDFAKNTIKVGAWGMAVAAAAAPVALATYSLQRMIEVGSQTARLEQVFSKVGGSARELTDDVMALAAANGRSSDEALESAVAWSRLGLSRVQVNEAVRVSLMAANVAEMTSGESTKHLSALMAAYSLNVTELDAVLGMLNNTSNKFNVTNSDLLTGLSRTAAVAKQAGIPLAELQGMIGAAVGRTGQTGANIGNAIKSVIVSMSTPDVQDFLQERFKLSTTGEEIGQMKTMSQVMRELYVTYMGLNDEERKSLTVRVAGKTQASRFVAILESYNQAQKLAADSQLHLNSAEQENARILATQKAQLVGIRTEWDRLVTRASVGGSMIPAAAVGGGAGMLAGRLATGAMFGGRFGPIGAGIGAGLGLMSGGSANEQLTDAEGLLKNLLKMFNMGGQIQKRKPLAIEKLVSDNLMKGKGGLSFMFSKESAQQMGEMSLKDKFDSWRHPVRWLKATSDLALGNDKDAVMQSLQGKLGDQMAEESASSGHETEARRLRTLAEVVTAKDSRPEELKNLFKTEQESLRVLVERGEYLEAQDELLALAAEREHDAMDARARGAALQQSGLSLLNQQLEIQQKIVASEKSSDDEKQDARDKIKDYQSIQQDMEKRRREMLSEDSDIASGNQEERGQWVMNRKSATARQMESVAAFSNVQKSVLLADQMLEENRVIEQQIHLLRDLSKEFSNSGRDVAATKVDEQRRDLQSHLRSGADIDAARTLDRRSLYTRRAEGDVANMGGGTSSAERLLNTEKGISEELARLKKRQADWSLSAAQHEADNARALVLQNQLLNTREGIQKRIRDLVFEEKQARLEGQREFNKSLLMSGPGELLRKFAANQLASQGRMTAGQFMAMSPEMRGDVDQRNGGERMRSVREENHRMSTYPELPQLAEKEYNKMSAEQLRNYRLEQAKAGKPRNIKSLSAEQEAAERAGAKDFRLETQGASGAVREMLDTAKVNAELNNVGIAAKTAGDGLGGLVGVVAAVKESLTSLSAYVLQAISGGGGGGLNTGHALGASN